MCLHNVQIQITVFTLNIQIPQVFTILVIKFEQVNFYYMHVLLFTLFWLKIVALTL